MEDYLLWLEEHVSKQVAERFFSGVLVNSRRIAINPEIGKVEPAYKRSGFIVRSMLIDKYYRIYYRYNSSQVVILTVWDMRGIKRR